MATIKKMTTKRIPRAFEKVKKIPQEKLNKDTPTIQAEHSDELNNLQVDTREPKTHYSLKDCTDLLNKAQILRYALETDLLACDAKWTLFVAAALSYRYDLMLQPFPPQYATESNGININALASVISNTPTLRVILQSISEENEEELDKDVIDLLYWVFIEKREPALRLVEGEELTSLLTSISESSLQTQPSHVFEVNALTGFHSEVEFRNRNADFPLKSAFMGLKFDNIFSILQNGFMPPSENLKLKLTTDLATSLKHSPNCAAWGASQCGSIIACTSICDFVLDANEENIMSQNKNEKSCVDIHLSKTQNVRARYLLFFGRRLPRSSVIPRRPFLSWLFQHKYSISLLTYMFFIVSIGIANSGGTETFKSYVTKKAEFVLEFCRKTISKESFL